VRGGLSFEAPSRDNATVMRVFVAGAGGAIGLRLVPALVSAGHSVVGMIRSPAKAEAIRAAGGEPLVADALDEQAVVAAVKRAEPEIVVHELTALPSRINLRRFDRAFEVTNRLRREGTDHLVAAARAAGARRLVAQSFAGWPYAREGNALKSEQDPLDPNPPPGFRTTLDAIRYLEATVLAAEGLEGVALRYGPFYGPGTSIGEGGSLVEDVRRRRVPVVGNGGGVWSFLHVDDAAQATLAAIERGFPGIYNVVDDEPAPVSEWLPALAAAVGAKPPRRVPGWLARVAIGEHGVAMMTQIRGASNAKAKRELGWQPTWTSWREGFREGLS
jgi:nucleoside-diphosphate-sugar epimerase